jgi:hypothetical protein
VVLHKSSVMVFLAAAVALSFAACSSSNGGGGSQDGGGTTGSGSGGSGSEPGSSSGGSSGALSSDDGAIESAAIGVDAPVDSFLDASGTVEGGDSGGACNTINTFSTSASDSESSMTTPTPMGGTIVVGTYQKTGWTAYASCLPSSSGLPDTQTTWVVTPSSDVSGFIETSERTKPQYSTRASYATTGSSLTLQQACPFTTSFSYSFTATATEIDYFEFNKPFTAADGSSQCEATVVTFFMKQ